LTAWRVWPILSWKTREGVGRQVGWLWPLGHHIRRAASGDEPAVAFDAFLPLFFRGSLGERRLVYYFPFYGQFESPGQKTTAWLWPLLTVTRHHDPQWKQWRFFYIIGNYQRGSDRSQTSLFPLWGTKSRGGEESLYVLYPIYHNRSSRKTDGMTFKRRYLVPLWHDERWENPDGSLHERRWGLTPLVRRRERNDGLRETSWLHLWFGNGAPGVWRNWAPLWTIYMSRDDPEGNRERQILGRIWRWRRFPNERTEWEVNFLLGRYVRTHEGDRNLTLLGIKFGG
jgi:hypothetical protein